MVDGYMQMANSTLMWLVGAPTVLWVVFQAWLFFKRSKADGLRMGLQPIQLERAVRSASIASVGPCFVMLSGMLTLIIYVGAPLAWMHGNVIGSSAYELATIQFVADSMGLPKLSEVSTDTLNQDFLAIAVIVLASGCVPWMIFAALFSDKMEKVNRMMSGGNAKLVPVLGGGAILGCFGLMTVDSIYPFGSSGWAVIASGASMGCITVYNKKADRQWLKEWGLTICMIVGMTAAVLA